LVEVGFALVVVAVEVVLAGAEDVGRDIVPDDAVDNAADDEADDAADDAADDKAEDEADNMADVKELVAPDSVAEVVSDS
jgi:hypothetical protein